MEGAKRNMLLYVGIAAIVVIGIGYLLFTGTGTTSPLLNQTVSAQELSALSSVANNQSLASTVGITAYTGANSALYFKKINDTPLMYAGKPELLYVGAEFCPYCAASRWAMILALMRFGNMSGIRYSQSSSTDVFQNTPTFTFYPNYSFTSKYLSFRAFETETRTAQPLQQLDNVSEAIYYKYANAIPFFDFGGYYVSTGSIIDPGIYKGMSWAQITSEIAQPNTQISQEVIGAANIYTAQICHEINNTAPVCSQSYVQAADSKFLS
jgi:hypothetical protein